MEQIIKMDQLDVLSCRIWLGELRKQVNQQKVDGGILKIPIPSQRELESLRKLSKALEAADVFPADETERLTLMMNRKELIACPPIPGVHMLRVAENEYFSSADLIHAAMIIDQHNECSSPPSLNDPAQMQQLRQFGNFAVYRNKVENKYQVVNLLTGHRYRELHDHEEDADAVARNDAMCQDMGC